MLQLLSLMIGTGLQTFIIVYSAGAIWTFLNWTKTIQEITATARLAADRRDKALANSLRQSARDTYAEGIWAIPAWPVVVFRNIRAVLDVRKDCIEREKAKKASEESVK